jgi:hypothetical protein
MMNFSIDVLQFLQDNHIEFKDKGTNVGYGRVNIQCYSCDDPSKHLSINQTTGQFICRRCGECGSFDKLVRKINGQNILDLYIKEKDSVQRKPAGVWSLLDTFVPMSEMDSRTAPYMHYCIDRKVSTNRFIHWYCGTGKYAGYVIIPVKKDNEIVSFVGRKILGSGPKYSNCPEVVSGVALSSLCYCTPYDNKYPLVIVEGIFDGERLGMNTLSLLGKISVTPDKTDYIKQMNPPAIVVALDSDTSEQERSRIADLLSICGKPVKILNFTGKKDMGEMSDIEIQSIRNTLFPDNAMS